MYAFLSLRRLKQLSQISFIGENLHRFLFFTKICCLLCKILFQVTRADSASVCLVKRQNLKIHWTSTRVSIQYFFIKSFSSFLLIILIWLTFNNLIYTLFASENPICSFSCNTLFLVSFLTSSTLSSSMHILFQMNLCCS